MAIGARPAVVAQHRVALEVDAGQRDLGGQKLERRRRCAFHPQCAGALAGRDDERTVRSPREHVALEGARSRDVAAAGQGVFHALACNGVAGHGAGRIHDAQGPDAVAALRGRDPAGDPAELRAAGQGFELRDRPLASRLRQDAGGLPQGRSDAAKPWQAEHGDLARHRAVGDLQAYVRTEDGELQLLAIEHSELHRHRGDFALEEQGTLRARRIPLKHREHQHDGQQRPDDAMAPERERTQQLDPGHQRRRRVAFGRGLAQPEDQPAAARAQGRPAHIQDEGEQREFQRVLARRPQAGPRAPPCEGHQHEPRHLAQPGRPPLEEVVPGRAQVQHHVLHQLHRLLRDGVAQVAVTRRGAVVEEVGEQAHRRERHQQADASPAHAQAGGVDRQQGQRDHAARHGPDAQHADQAGQGEVAPRRHRALRRPVQQVERQQGQPLRQEELALEAPDQVLLLHPGEQDQEHEQGRHLHRNPRRARARAFAQDRAEGEETREDEQVVDRDQEGHAAAEEGVVDPEQDAGEHDAVLVVQRPPVLPMALGQPDIEVDVARPHVPVRHRRVVPHGAHHREQHAQRGQHPHRPGDERFSGNGHGRVRCSSCGRRTGADGGSPS